MKEKNSKTRIKMGQGQQCSTATPKTDQLHTILQGPAAAAAASAAAAVERAPVFLA